MHSALCGWACGICYSQWWDFAFELASADSEFARLTVVSSLHCGALVRTGRERSSCFAGLARFFNRRFEAGLSCLDCSCASKWQAVFKLRFQDFHFAAVDAETVSGPLYRPSQTIAGLTCQFLRCCSALAAKTSITAICFHLKIR